MSTGYTNEKLQAFYESTYLNGRGLVTENILDGGADDVGPEVGEELVDENLPKQFELMELARDYHSAKSHETRTYLEKKIKRELYDMLTSAEEDNMDSVVEFKHKIDRIMKHGDGADNIGSDDFA